MPRFAPTLLLLALAVSAPAHAQTESDRVAPTIPESQIEPAELSSAYQFISAATSADRFVIDAAAIAATNAEAAEVKALAQELSGAHQAAMDASMAAANADKVEVAEPSVDGEQQGLLGKLQALRGAEFDRAYLESQLFVYQRTIAYFRGYAGEEDALAGYARDALPELVTRYASLLALAADVGLGSAAQTPAAQ